MIEVRLVAGHAAQALQVDNESTSSSCKSTALSDLTAAELTDNLFKRLKAVKPVNMNDSGAKIEHARVLLRDFNECKNADEKWRGTAPKTVVSRLTFIILIIKYMMNVYMSAVP